MKILYAIQGTGNGHLSRAMDIIPCLQKHGELDLLVSGIQGDLHLPYPIKYESRGLSFIFGKSGGVDLWKTFAKANLRKLVKSIHHLPLAEYDLILNDFEPVSAWACYLRNKECISLSHQAAVLHKSFPQPDDSDKVGRTILKNYAPTSIQYGFHFWSESDTIFTPVIRRAVREHEITDEGHYTVYLPAYDDGRLIRKLSEYPEVRWDVFSKHNFKKLIHNNITVQPIDNKLFTASMASSSGVLCGAGFETPAEALFLGKKLLVMPMKNQYEQQLNAEALKQMGVQVIKNFKPKYAFALSEWLINGNRVPVNYPDITQQIIDSIVERHGVNS